jgi:D-alanyl-D-alanine carboxypeptidase (penicillin-binding protein 5/6)
MSQSAFVNVMNQTAKSLGLKSTHYVDVTGISSGDVSTAANQVVVTADLMSEEPVVRGIVILPQVSLPLAGVVQSYTPFTGQSNVIGVKSGYTNDAGGCDAMAVVDTIGTSTYTTYVVVLGQHTWNALGVAGGDALALSRSIRTLMARVRTSSGIQVEWIGSPSDVATTTTTTSTTSTTTTTTTLVPTT